MREKDIATIPVVMTTPDYLTTEAELLADAETSDLVSTTHSSTDVEIVRLGRTSRARVDVRQSKRARRAVFPSQEMSVNRPQSRRALLNG